MSDISIVPSKHDRYPWEVIAPSKVFGKRLRIRCKTQAKAREKKQELDRDYNCNKLGAIDPDVHALAVRFQGKLTLAQMEEALAKAVDHCQLTPATFADLANDFKAQVKRLFERGVVGVEYWKNVRIRTPRLIKWMGKASNKPAKDFTKKDVEAFVDARVADGYRPKYIKNLSTLLTAIMEFGVEEGVVAVNVARTGKGVRKVKLPKITKVPTILTPDEAAKSIEAAATLKQLKARGTDFSLMLAWLMFGLFGGLRTCETRRLQWEDIRLDEGQFYVSPSKNDKPRWVAITSPLEHYLKQLLATSRTGAVLLNRAEYTLQEHMTKLRKATGVEIPQNTLRHSFASNHLVHFDNPANTATELGHHSPQVTFDFYRRAVTKAQAKAYWDLRASL